MTPATGDMSLGNVRTKEMRVFESVTGRTYTPGVFLYSWIHVFIDLSLKSSVYFSVCMIVYVILFVCACVCVCALNVGTSLGPHRAVQGQRFVECDQAVVEGGFANTAVEGGQAGRQARDHSTIRCSPQVEGVLAPC